MNYDNDEYAQQLQADIDNNKDLIKFGESLARLLKNQDFITVIQKEYCEAGALRLVTMLKADSVTEDIRKKSMEKLEAISLFQEFLRVQSLVCANAYETVKQAQETLDEVRGE